MDSFFFGGDDAVYVVVSFHTDICLKLDHLTQNHSPMFDMCCCFLFLSLCLVNFFVPNGESLGLVPLQRSGLSGGILILSR